MSGYPSGAGESSGGSNSNGLDSLFAQLRQQQNKPINLEPSYAYYNNSNYSSGSQLPQSHGYQQPSVSSALPTPPVPSAQPHHGSAIISPAETPQPRMPTASGSASNADRTSSLLNLLKFSQPAVNSPNQSAPIGTPLPASREATTSYGGADGHKRGSSDLLATLMGNVQAKPTQHGGSKISADSQPRSSFSPTATSPPADTQAYLLQLLNQPKPTQSESSTRSKPTKALTPPGKGGSQDQIDDVSESLEDASMNMNMMGSAATEAISTLPKDNTRDSTPKNLFTYVNPFEQLAASSPRNRTPKNATPTPAGATNPGPIQILKHPRQESPETRVIREKSKPLSPSHPRQNMEPNSQQSSAPPTPLPDGRTQLEALIGIGASGHKETVHEALSEVGPQVDKQVQEAIARVERDESQASIEQDLRDMLAAKTDKEFERNAKVTALAIKKELDKDENSHALDDLPAPVAEAVQEIINDTAQGHIADSWESADAEDSPIKEEEESHVKVFNFPMRPWTSITIKGEEETRPVFRDDAIMDIARLKKEFDQVDRTLVTASNSFIVYGMSKNGGVRIIRQDDGKDARLFTETHDRIFSVATSSSSIEMKEAIISTGISGTVYWALIKDGEGDRIEDSNPEMYGFALPPLQSQDNESPGGVLKTRARKSSNHPDFFAVGRGKYIQIIWPSLIMKQSFLKNGKDRIVDSEKYLNHHSLKVNIGKAGKDFTFSEDDTTIVSLDKAGRVKFWDIRKLILTENLKKMSQVEIKEPLVTFTTTPASEKSWPTSVLFVDKLRPYQRGGALRYLIVGLKQNHTLQLWDLALGKPVQEINLPHGKESDAVCSVMYHAATGMIVVGHPTRNSIYFLHLSAPKYNLPKSITQAEYMEMLVANDPSIPKPESTGVISGMREYSFANKGNLRSLDILQTPNSASGSESSTMFELYAMHSKGVTCLNIRQADLGWTSDNKVIHPVVADKAGIISIDTLRELPAAPILEPSETAPQPSVRIVPRPIRDNEIGKGTKETATKENTKIPTLTAKIDEKPDKKEQSHSNGATAPANAPEKSEKKKGRRKGTSTSETSASVPSGTHHTGASKPIVLDPMSNSRNGTVSKVNLNPIPEASSLSHPQNVNEDAVKSIEARVTAEVKKLLDESFGTLNKEIKVDRQTQAAVSDAKQDAMLRLVSSTLSENIEGTLDRIVSSSIQKSVLPVIIESTSKAINDQLGLKLNHQLSQVVPRDLQKILPDVIGKALQQPQLLKLMSESLAKSVAFRVEEQFAVLMQNVITPSFTNLAIQTSQRVAADVQRQASEQMDKFEHLRHADSIKIEQLTHLVTGLTETVSSMAAAQTEFQGQFLRMQQQAAMERRQASSRQGDAHGSVSVSRPSTALTGPVDKSPEEIEYENMLASISKAMGDGQFENAVIQWLQTRREQEFFEKYFSKFNPEFIRHLSPLLLLSLGATISLQLDGELLQERVAWLEVILITFQAHVNADDLDDQVRDLIPKIMGIYIQRLEHLFMRISQVSAQDPLLKRLSLMVTSANRVLDSQ